MDREPVRGPGISVGSVIESPWSSLRRLTTARVGLGRAGVSQPTRHHLAFQLAHAQARDAVHSALDTTSLSRDLAGADFASIVVQSQASDRATYLQRPDLGRRLHPDSVERLRSVASDRAAGFDIAFIVADGLSALGVQRHAAPLLSAVVRRSLATSWRVAPIIIVEGGRVAISDEVGQLLKADIAVILIGERPGLSSPDSLGVYLTFGPRVGNTDANRNCISNIRDEGLSYDAAATTLGSLLTEAFRRRLSGVMLKDDAPGATLLGEERRRNFLVAPGMSPRQHDVNARGADAPPEDIR